MTITMFARLGLVGMAQSGSIVYYVRVDGNDDCRGVINAPDALPNSDVCAFQTIKQALTVVKPGDTISILPGIYREPITPRQSGAEGQPITIKAENGPNTVYFYASENIHNMVWQNYSDYVQSGGSLNLQTGVDPNHIKFIELDWCYTEEPDLVRDFYDNCSDVPASKIAIPFESDLIAIVKNEGTPSREVIRLPKAKEPDWTAETPWKYSENWWKADSGAISLDDGNASAETTSGQFLKDTLDDQTLDEDLDGEPDFPYLPAGNIKDIFDQNDFTDPKEAQAPAPGEVSSKYATIPKKISLGATIIFNDGLFGHYTDNLFIKDYNPATGIIELQDPRGPIDNDQDRLQYLTKFYIEGTPKAMDCPGEWVHHDGKLFVLIGTGCGRTVTEGDLQNLEIAQRFQILNLDSISHMVIKDINFSFGNTNRFGSDLYKVWHEGLPRYLFVPPRLVSVSSDPGKNSGAAKNVIFDGITISHSMTGMTVEGDSQATEDNLSQLTIKNSRFEDIDDIALKFSNYYPDLSVTSFSVFDPLIIEDNSFNNIGFRPITGEGLGVYLYKASNVIFRQNIVQNVGQNSVQFHQGWDQFISNNLLIEANVFDNACQMAADCGGLKFHGGAKSYNDVLVTNNVSKNNRGWTYAIWRRTLNWSHPNVGQGNWWKYTRLGTMAHGYYLDYASGITFYRNLALNNGNAGIFMNFNYRDGKLYIFNNTFHDALNGLEFSFMSIPGAGNSTNWTHSPDHSDTKIVGNIFSKLENAGIYLGCSASDEYTPHSLKVKNVEIDRNVYKRYSTNPQPNPYWWFNETDYAPVDLHYQGCDNQTYNYDSVAVLQDKTSWEAQGRDWQEGEALYINENGNNKEDYNLADNSIVSETRGFYTPLEVSSLAARLEAELGVNIALFEPSRQIYFPMLLK